jgi:hypothetical protein
MCSNFFDYSSVLHLLYRYLVGLFARFNLQGVIKGQLVRGCGGGARKGEGVTGVGGVGGRVAGEAGQVTEVQEPKEVGRRRSCLIFFLCEARLAHGSMHEASDEASLDR